MPESTTRLFRKIHPQLQIFLMYGLTEAFRSSYLPHDQVDQRPTSIGKAIPNVELLVINEQGERCKPGEEGELVHRGANIAMGYWRDAESTAQRFRPAPFQQQKGGQPEIAVYSGDFVKTDEEGFLYFIGRKDQMIKSHGMRVSPEEIEHYLFTSGLLTHVAVFAVTSVDGTSQIIAAIVPKDPAIFTTQQIQQFCKTELPEYLRPAVFWSVPAVPQTSSGKPDRIQLRKIYNEQHNA
jgi:acyl-CoA synthetase (AMP-forming)/AMP-acid ligase II